MNEWIKCKLGDQINLKRGHDLPSRRRIEGIVPIVSSSGITGFHNEEKEQGPGVVTGRYGTIGNVFFIPSSYWPLNTTLYVEDFKGNDERFVYYFLKTLNWKKFSDKSAVPGINRNDVHEEQILFPPLKEQERIATILSSLEEKVTLNYQIIENLEVLTQKLFKHWCIDFDFPDQNGNPYKSFGGKMKESELGSIPEKWSVKTIGEVSHCVTKGDTPRQKAIDSAPKDDRLINLIKVNSIAENGELLIDKISQIPETIHLGKSKRSILKEGYILYTNAGTIGRVAIVREDYLPANTNQAVAIIQTDNSKVSSEFLYMMVKHKEFQDSLHSNITQSVQKNLALGEISKAKFVCPSHEILAELTKPLSSLLLSIHQYRKESQIINTILETILPKLVRGEITITGK